jgi:pyruvate formate lyase activating enzyme
MQPSFSRALLRELKGAGIHTAIDTCGQCTWENLEALLPHTDLVLYDIKLMYRSRHKECTGVGNERILDNLLRIAELMQERKMPRALWIRTPIIPGYTADEENIRVIGQFIREKLSGVVGKWELCTFNNLCLHKYASLGLAWPFSGCDPLTEDDARHLAESARDSGVDPGIVQISGPLKKADANETSREKVQLSIIKGGAYR